MRRAALITLTTLGLAAAPIAFAEQAPAQEPKAAPKAMKMTDAQLDKVAAGQLVDVEVYVIDVLNNPKVAVAVPINAAAAVNVLGGATGAGAIQRGRPGRISQ